MPEQFINPTTARFPVGTIMLMWFTNPDNNGPHQGLACQFFGTLKDAEDMAGILSGSRIILMCTAQNPGPNRSNIYWDTVKIYGESFDLKLLTIIPDNIRDQFLKKPDPNMN